LDAFDRRLAREPGLDELVQCIVNCRERHWNAVAGRPGANHFRTEMSIAASERRRGERGPSPRLLQTCDTKARNGQIWNLPGHFPLQSFAFSLVLLQVAP
jgi:hypothetical protein